jgi:type I restriction enzyme S subunit
MEKIGKYITKYVKGKTPKELYKAPAEGLLPYLSPDYLRDKSAPEFYASPSSKTVQVDDGEVIVLWDGSNAGEIFISKKGILASTMVKLDFDEAEIYKPYYSYSFQYLEYVLKAKTAGSGIPHADKGVIKRLEFFKPEIPEQKAIATILSKVDEAIKATENSIKAAEKLKKSLMQNLLTGKLKPDGTWRKEDEFYKDEKFGNVPVGWEVKKLKKIFKLKNGKGNPTENLRSEPIAEFQIPVYGGNGITGYFDKPFLTSSTLIIGRVGEYCGSVYKTPNQSWVTDNALWISEVFIESFDLDFWYSLLTFKKLNQYGDATGQPKITQSGIGNLKVAYPPNIEEQNNISSKIIQIDSLILEKKSKLQSTIKLKKSLMQNLLTGKVRVDVNKIEKLLQEQ